MCCWCVEIEAVIAFRFRVFYQVQKDARLVRVLAVGVKNRDRLLIGGEEFPG
jgi:hypothetical protein